MDIAIVVDNPESWFVRYADRLAKQLAGNNTVKVVGSAMEVAEGTDIAFLLSCEKRVCASSLARSRHNIVVHASDLPQGRGMSPLTWQILEGRSSIVVSLFEAVEAIDAGPIYIKRSIAFRGDELLHEMQDMLAQTIMQMCVEFVMNYATLSNCGISQAGNGSRYRRRYPADSKLDPHKTIAEQFNLLRVVDNDRYPAYFELNGRKYLLRIEAAETS